MEAKTDLDRFKELYDSLDIKYLIRNEVDTIEMIIGDLNYWIDDYDEVSKISEHNGSKIDGYGCFHTRIEFDKSGKFITQGFWE